jgi:putative membrane protein
MTQINQLKELPENQQLLRKLKVAVWVISAAVLGLVVLMREVKIPLPDGISLSFLPPFHAFLNTVAAISLIMALVAIKKGKALLHQRWIYAAMICSLLFLLSYVTYHFTTPETIYGDVNGDGEMSAVELTEAGSLRTVYLVILLSHIVLAAVSLPFILLTFCYGFTNHFTKHKKLSRKIFPVWLYVAVTGPVVYLLLSPYY